MSGSPAGKRRSQAERRRSTRDALLAAGHRLFTERGVAAVAAGEVVDAAGVTRGALYHHFQDKNDLFRAVYEQLEAGLCAEFVQRMDDANSPVEGLVRGVSWFLDVCERPDVRRVALLDAPAVLGWAEWRRIEQDYALGVLTERLAEAAEDPGVTLPGPADVVAGMLFSTVIDAALTIGNAEDPEAERARVEPVLLGLAARTLGLG